MKFSEATLLLASGISLASAGCPFAELHGGNLRATNPHHNKNKEVTVTSERRKLVALSSVLTCPSGKVAVTTTPSLTGDQYDSIVAAVHGTYGKMISQTLPLLFLLLLGFLF